MKWLPYESWEVMTSVDLPTLVDGLKKQIEPTKWFRWWSRNHTPLQGRIDFAGFCVSRVIHYRNSFLPILYGRFQPTEYGTVIRIKMMLHPLVLGFLAYWFGMLGLFGLAGLLALIYKGDWTIIFVCLVMGLFALVMTYVCFWAEAPKAKRLLAEAIADVQKEVAARLPSAAPQSH